MTAHSAGKYRQALAVTIFGIVAVRSQVVGFQDLPLHKGDYPATGVSASIAGLVGDARPRCGS